MHTMQLLMLVLVLLLVSQPAPSGGAKLSPDDEIYYSQFLTENPAPDEVGASHRFLRCLFLN